MAESLGRLRAAAAVGLGLLALHGCQAPSGLSVFHYGEGADCAMDLGPKPVSLQVSLDPLRDEFDRFSEIPRVVALMPHMGCERGAEILRQQVLDAYPESDLRLLVIWQDLARTDGSAAAARRATLFLEDERVTAFHDCAGLAGRAFARGNLPVAEAREVFLFYPAGTLWPRPGAGRTATESQVRPGDGSLGQGRAHGDDRSFAGGARTGTEFTGSVKSFGAPARPISNGRGGPVARKTSGVQDVTPRTDSWVHQLGRVAPEKFCTAQELPGEMRLAVQRLLQQAESRRQRLARR